VRNCLAIGILLSSLAIAWSGCGRNAGISYPLSEGATWRYQILSPRMPSGNRLTAVLTNLPQRDLNGKKVTPQKLEVRESRQGKQLTGQTYSFFVGEDGDGIYGFASQSDRPEEDTKFTPSYHIIKRPVEVGTSWETPSPFSIRPGHDLMARLTIESTSEAVTVPAGTFQNCMKIKVSGTPVFDRGRFGVLEKELALDSYLWFAPGVGLIKGTMRIAREDVSVQLETYHL
jgi:hypothetical protein